MVPEQSPLEGELAHQTLALRPAAGLTRVLDRWPAFAAPVLLALLALLLSLPRLTVPDTYVFDELYYAYTAGKYVTGAEAYNTDVLPRDDPAIEWTHPPLAKLLIAGGMLVAGDNPLGWRWVNALFGAMGVVITYLLAMRLEGDRAIALIAGGLLLLDGLYLVESRTGMSNLFLVVLTNGALLAFSRVLAAPPGNAGGALFVMGLLLGLAVATKWSAVALLGLIGLALVWRTIRQWQADRTGDEHDPANARVNVRKAITSGLLALVIIPIAVYLASYLHFFLTGHDLTDFVALHQDMFAYHRGLGVVHRDSSPWWMWPLDARPVWYFYEETRQSGSYVLGLGNPLLYWPMVVAAGWVAIDWWGRRPAALLILAIGFFGQWLPWALSPRGTFIYHFLPAVPLGCVALAVLVRDGWRWGGVRRWLAGGYVLATVAVFIYFYPMFTAIPVSRAFLDAHLWFDSWR